ncbi:hypothetical protein K456DRAFT_53354 [Colletotrichum gloeosporioides 23]|nr:hypothetical protein K456DRAFT_53354 [Colletotrichum gloeosporioides 23]
MRARVSHFVLRERTKGQAGIIFFRFVLAANWKLQKIEFLGSYVVGLSCLCLGRNLERLGQWRGYRGALFKPETLGIPQLAAKSFTSKVLRILWVIF